MSLPQKIFNFFFNFQQFCKHEWTEIKKEKELITNNNHFQNGTSRVSKKFSTFVFSLYIFGVLEKFEKKSENFFTFFLFLRKLAHK